MRIILSLIFLISFAATIPNHLAFASDKVSFSTSIAKCQSAVAVKPMCIVEKIEQKSSKPVLVAKSGCCSYHHGVCGCASDGHQLCCDGAESPSCGC